MTATTVLALSYLRGLLGSIVRDERAQDAFEYLLVIGGVSVFVVLTMATIGLDTAVEAVIDGVCSAIDGIPGFTIAAGSCTP